MSDPIDLIKGFPGKPSHPPLTDASIGAYTVEHREEMDGGHRPRRPRSRDCSTGSTSSRGRQDEHRDPRPSCSRSRGSCNSTGTSTDVVETGAWILGLGAESLLAAGGYIGGSLVFVYGLRVLKRRETPVTDALIPGRAEGPPEHGA
jgi:hypothetical protein